MLNSVSSRPRLLASLRRSMESYAITPLNSASWVTSKIAALLNDPLSVLARIPRELHIEAAPIPLNERDRHL